MKNRVHALFSCVFLLNMILLYTTLSSVGIDLDGRLHMQKCSAVRQSIFAYWYGGILIMAVSYKKLWKLLIDKDMKKKDLCAKAGISPASVTKMGRNGHVTTEVLLKICTALNCQIGDIVEIVPDQK